MWLILVNASFSADFPVKVHDRSGLLTGEEVKVELSPGKGTTGATMLQVRDDGQDPDVVAGDRLFTGKAVGVELQSGRVTVTAKGQSWSGDFLFDPGSDPVILVGLEGPGRAGVSTHEVMFFPDKQGGPGGAGAAGGGQPGGGPPPGGPPQGGGPETRQGSTPGGSPGSAHKTRTTPEGMWLGWLLLTGAIAGLGALAWSGAHRPARLPDWGPVATTSARRGPRGPFEGLDLVLGPENPTLGEGRYTPEELTLLVCIARGEGRPVRLVINDSSRVEAEDGFRRLSELLQGRAELVWEEPVRP